MTVVYQHNYSEHAYPISVFALCSYTTVTERVEACLAFLPLKKLAAVRAREPACFLFFKIPAFAGTPKRTVLLTLLTNYRKSILYAAQMIN